MALKLYTVIACALLISCSSEDSTDSFGETVVEEEGQTELVQSEENQNNDLDESEADVGQVTIVGPDTSGSSPHIGTWLNCIGGAVASGFIFTETNYQFFLNNECSEVLTAESSSRSGIYKIVGNGISEEGLPFIQLELQDEFVSGLPVINPLPNTFLVIHADANTLFTGTIDMVIDETNDDLALDFPYTRVQ